MVSESGTRSRGRRGSRTPMSRDSRSPSPRRRQDSRSRSRSRTRSRSYSRSPSPRRNGRYRSRSRSYSRDQSWSRSRSRSRDRGDGIKSTKIVVERLTKNVTEDHLREIFGQFGPIDDLDLPMNRQFNSNRGTAYILYVDELDAETAVANMHEGQIDGAIINVSIVLPRRKISPHPDGPPWSRSPPRALELGEVEVEVEEEWEEEEVVVVEVQIPTPAP
ncbi:unnamed protein product [Parascedosporium putredinis]|uniref:RRM domain-containing protein n=1 Tax=Parascedosporium putredinis TaxID=1442378 RepID=A0A9P1M5U9_9PEZI|nr:unnamed protein product [Parascedosporium putredinis]CAI7988477.1 unnamed protein product [Parascedosporium putredinis]